MRILMISHSKSTWSSHFAKYFQGRGDDLLLVSFSPHPLDGVRGVNVEFVGDEPFDIGRNKHLFLTRVPKIRRIVKRYRPDVVFAPYLSSNGLSAVLSWPGPTLVSAVGGDVLNHVGRTGLRRSLREMSIRFVCRRADVINSVSQPLTDELVRLGVSSAKILQMPFGVDLRQFLPDPGMPRLLARTLICTRRHEPVYSIPTVIHALERLKAAGRPFRAIFTCGGRFLADHKRLVSNLGLDDRVLFTGDLSHGELPSLLRQSDIYISASLGDGTSVALLEAMACGLLPVVSDIPANRPWIDHRRNGLLFPTADAVHLAEMLAIAMDDSQLRENALNQNRSRVEAEADMKKNMDRLATVLEGLAGGSPSVHLLDPRSLSPGKPSPLAPQRESE
jgi:glycosyltransferase involved in cell wall biosynthesis